MVTTLSPTLFSGGLQDAHPAVKPNGVVYFVISPRLPLVLQRSGTLRITYAVTWGEAACRPSLVCMNLQQPNSLSLHPHLWVLELPFCLCDFLIHLST